MRFSFVGVLLLLLGETCAVFHATSAPFRSSSGLIPRDLANARGDTHWDAFADLTAQCYFVTSSDAYYATAVRGGTLDTDPVLDVAQCAGIEGPVRGGLPTISDASLTFGNSVHDLQDADNQRAIENLAIQESAATGHNLGIGPNSIFNNAHAWNPNDPHQLKYVWYGYSGGPAHTDLPVADTVQATEAPNRYYPTFTRTQEVVCLEADPNTGARSTVQTPEGVYDDTTRLGTQAGKVHYRRGNPEGLGAHRIYCDNITASNGADWIGVTRSGKEIHAIWHGNWCKKPLWYEDSVEAWFQGCHIFPTTDNKADVERIRANPNDQYFMSRVGDNNPAVGQCTPERIYYSPDHVKRPGCGSGDLGAYPAMNAAFAALLNTSGSFLDYNLLAGGEPLYLYPMDPATNAAAPLQPRASAGTLAESDEAVWAIDTRNGQSNPSVAQDASRAAGIGGRAMGAGYARMVASSTLPARQNPATMYFDETIKGSFVFRDNQRNVRMMVKQQKLPFGSPAPIDHRMWCGPQLHMTGLNLPTFRVDDSANRRLWHMRPHYGISAVPTTTRGRQTIRINPLGFPICRYGFLGSQCEWDFRMSFPVTNLDPPSTLPLNDAEANCRGGRDRLNAGTNQEPGTGAKCTFADPTPLTCADYDPCGGRGVCLDSVTVTPNASAFDVRSNFRTLLTQLTETPPVPTCACFPGWVTPPMRALRNASEAGSGPIWGATAWYNTYFGPFPPSDTHGVYGVSHLDMGNTVRATVRADADGWGRPRIRGASATDARWIIDRIVGGHWMHFIRASHQCTMWVGGTLYPDRALPLDVPPPGWGTYNLDSSVNTSRFLFEAGHTALNPNGFALGADGLPSGTAASLTASDGGKGVYGAQPGLFYTYADSEVNRTAILYTNASYPLRTVCASPAGDTCLLRCEAHHAGPTCQPCNCNWTGTDFCTEAASVHDNLGTNTGAGIAQNIAVHVGDTQCVCRTGFAGTRCQLLLAPKDANGHFCGGPARGFVSRTATTENDPLVYAHDCNCKNGWEGAACDRPACPAFVYSEAWRTAYGGNYTEAQLLVLRAATEAYPWPCFQQPWSSNSTGSDRLGTARIQHGQCNHETRQCVCTHTHGPSGFGYRGDRCEQASCPRDTSGFPCGAVERCNGNTGRCQCLDGTAYSTLVTSATSQWHPGLTSSPSAFKQRFQPLLGVPNTGTVDPTDLRYGTSCQNRWTDTAACGNGDGRVCGSNVTATLGWGLSKEARYCGPTDLRTESSDAQVPRCWCPAYLRQDPRDRCTHSLCPLRCSRHLGQGVEILQFAAGNGDIHEYAWEEPAAFTRTHGSSVVPDTLTGEGRQAASLVQGCYCECRPGFVGADCSVNATASCVNPLDPTRTCSGQGRCTRSQAHNDGAFYCACNATFFGEFCEQQDVCGADCFADIPRAVCDSATATCGCAKHLAKANASDTRCSINRCTETGGDWYLDAGQNSRCHCPPGSRWWFNSTDKGCRVLCPSVGTEECGVFGGENFCVAQFVNEGNGSPQCTCTEGDQDYRRAVGQNGLTVFYGTGHDGVCENYCITGTSQTIQGQPVCTCASDLFDGTPGRTRCDPRFICNGRQDPHRMDPVPAACSCSPTWAYGGDRCEVDKCAALNAVVNITADPRNCTCQGTQRRDATGRCDPDWQPTCPVGQERQGEVCIDICGNHGEYDNATGTCRCWPAYNGTRCESVACLNGGQPERAAIDRYHACRCLNTRFAGDLCEQDRCPSTRGTWDASIGQCTCLEAWANPIQWQQPEDRRVFCTRSLCAPGIANASQTGCDCSGAPGFALNASTGLCTPMLSCPGSAVLNRTSGTCVCPALMDNTDGLCATRKCDPTVSRYNATSGGCDCHVDHSGDDCALDCPASEHLVPDPTFRACICEPEYRESRDGGARRCVSICEGMAEPDPANSTLNERIQWCHCQTGELFATCMGRPRASGNTSNNRVNDDCAFMHECRANCAELLRPGGRVHAAHVEALYPEAMQACICASPHCRRDKRECLFYTCPRESHRWLPDAVWWGAWGLLIAGQMTMLGLLLAHKQCCRPRAYDFQTTALPQ